MLYITTALRRFLFLHVQNSGIVAVFLRAYGGDDAPAAQETNRNEALEQITQS